MATRFTENLFSTTYKDDYRDSDNYYRILFNSGKALQARELTQSQTIIQKEIERFGRNIFKEGASVNPGGPTLNTRYEFIKLDTTSNVLPADTSGMIGDEFTGQTSGVKFKVLEVVAATATDPATVYVTYTDTTSGTAGVDPIRSTPGEEAVGLNSGVTVTVQATNTTANPAVGKGAKISVDRGDFFVQGHFVFVERQSKIIGKYTHTPSATVGFKITQDIITAGDNENLFDNQGATPNRSAPGADRYRIRLVLATEDEVDSDENFVYFCRVVNGVVFDTVTGHNQYSRIEDRLAQRTRDVSGDFFINPFFINYENDSDEAWLQAVVSSGLAYVNGYRVEKSLPTRLRIPKARDTLEITNQVSAASYGNYVIVTDLVGLPNINAFQVANLRDTTAHGGSTIGTCRIRAVEEDGPYYRMYIFDVVMNAGQSFSNIRSIGTSVLNYANIVQENSQTILYDVANNNLFFDLPYARPKSLTDISVEVQRRFTASLDPSGAATLTLTATGETFSNVNDWIISVDSDGEIISDNVTITGAGTQTASISGGPTSTNVELVAKVNKASATIRSKTLVSTSVTRPVVVDGDQTYIPLQKPDLFKLDRLRDSDSDGDDLINDFIVDNGQRDNWYGPAKLILKGDKTAPSGNVYARFRYFTHGASGDFFAANSYTGQVNYGDIPSHTLNDGTKVELRDVLDFRPRKTDGDSDFISATARVNELPTNTDLITFDGDFYLPRFDKIVLDQDGNVKVLQGRSALEPRFPDKPPHDLLLADVKLGSFTISDSDISLAPYESKLYTMDDIGKISAKVDTLFELTSLSLIETGLSNFSVFDSTGNDRTKAGFLVDNFANQLGSSFNNIEYRASVDPLSKTLRPGFREEAIRLIYDSDLSTNTVLKGDNIYLKYNEVEYIDQPQVSGTMNINPFAVITNLGSMELSPSSDEWRETRQAADVVVGGGTVNSFSGNQQQLFNNSQWNWAGTNLGATRSQVIGSSTSSASASSTTNSGVVSSVGNWRGAWDRTDTTTTTTTSTTSAVARVDSFSTIRSVVGERVIDVAMIPFMRSRRISFKCQGMKPNSRVFPFFDGVEVSNWVKSDTFTRVATTNNEAGNRYNRNTGHPDGSTSLFTDAEGKVEGEFLIPNTTTLRFRTGTREFKLLDISANREEDATSIGVAAFASTGVLETRQRTIQTTRVRNIVTSTQSSSSSTSRTTRGTANINTWNVVTGERRVNGTVVTPPRTVRQVDPLAQSFFVSDQDGVFLTSVDIFFQTKDDTIPVQLQIRPMINGSPASYDTIPGSIVFKSPASVNTSADASLATNFVFEEPVYLMPYEEYCVVLIAETDNYNVYIAETEQFILGSTEQRITAQPTLGSLFKSQNASTWEPDQTKDMMFKINRAEFTSASGEAIMQNASVPIRLLDPDPISTVAGSTRMTMYHPDHGFVVGDNVTIYGFDSATNYDGVKGTSILGNRTIDSADNDYISFDADSAATAGKSIGGFVVENSQNYGFEQVFPYVETNLPQSTSIAVSGLFTSGKSNAGSESPYVKDTVYSPLSLRENNFFETPKVVANDAIETANLAAGTKSATIKVDMDTTSNYVSPVLDLQRASLWLTHNRIDNQDSDGSSANNINIPLNFVAETNPTGGSSIAKHITRPVTLAASAVGLKIILAANRPSVADFDVYYKAISDDASFGDVNWVEVSKEVNLPSDENPGIFRDYEYIVGGPGGLSVPFNRFIIKIVMRTSNNAKPPTFKDLRVIALAV